MAADRKECSFSFPPLPPLFSFLILENHNMVLCFEHPRGNEAKIFWHQTKAYVCSCQLILRKGLRSYSWALILKNNLLHQFFILPIHTKGLMHLLFVSWLSGSEHLCLPTVPCYNVLSQHRPRNNRVKSPGLKPWMGPVFLLLSWFSCVFHPWERA